MSNAEAATAIPIPVTAAAPAPGTATPVRKVTVASLAAGCDAVKCEGARASPRACAR